MKIAVLGAGAYGTALGSVLAGKGYDVDYYDTRLGRERLSDVLEDAKTVVLSVPSEIATRLLPHLPKGRFLIVATKGFLTDEVFKEFRDWTVLSGAAFAADLRGGLEAKLTATDPRVMEMFQAENLRFDETSDRKGVLLCGALKNVYALWAGYCLLRPGTDVHEKYLKDTADEMRAILLANGADPMTVDLHCGVDDLRLTSGPGSRNYIYGQELAKNPKTKPETTVEGLTVLKRIRRGEINLPGNLPYLENLLRESEKWD